MASNRTDDGGRRVRIPHGRRERTAGKPTMPKHAGIQKGQEPTGSSWRECEQLGRILTGHEPAGSIWRKYEQPGRTRTGHERVGRWQKGKERTGPGTKQSAREPMDRGAGAITVLGICLVLIGLSVAALLMVQASIGAVRAAAAADLAALAAADVLRGLGTGPSAADTGLGPGPSAVDTGLGADPPAVDAVLGTSGQAMPGAVKDAVMPGAASGDACDVAREVASRNAASLRSCVPDSGTGIVSLEAEVKLSVLPMTATARARAGPPG